MRLLAAMHKQSSLCSRLYMHNYPHTRLSPPQPPPAKTTPPPPPQGPQDQGQHPQVRPHLPLVLHRARQAAQQGPHLPLPRQQVLHRVQDRRLYGHRHVGVWGEAQGAGGWGGGLVLFAGVGWEGVSW